jgi:hypothetical protein
MLSGVLVTTAWRILCVWEQGAEENIWAEEG